MSNLIVVTFDNEAEAGKVRESLHKGEKGGYISLDDSPVLVKEQDGKGHVKDELDRGVKIGAACGGLIFPIGGIILGALGGALAGTFADKGIQKKFIQEVSEAITPGSSAIFFIVRDAKPDYALGVLRNYESQVFYTSLAPEEEEGLRHALRKK